jgi:uncharacterized YccA/Bax inhibitor family protein
MRLLDHQQQRGVSRPLTIDDVVTKTGITLGVLSVVAVISYFMVSSNLALAMPLALVGPGRWCWC